MEAGCSQQAAQLADSGDEREASGSPSSSPQSSSVVAQSLQVFRHQVGGHAPLYWHSGTICKPLIDAELRFYSQLETDMPAFIPFVPKFYGLLDLATATDEMAASVATGDGNGSSSSSNSSSKQDIADDEKQQSSGPTAAASLPSQQQLLLLPASASASAAAAAPTPAASSSGEKAMSFNNRLCNRWAMQCQLRKQGQAQQHIQYLVLEDLSFAYSHPSILDLKLGTRQHADGESASKIASKTLRCLHSTSASLGLRLCGMQVYHPSSASFVYRDKYWGRALDVSGFRSALFHFLCDGERLLHEVATAFIARVERLRRAVVLWTQGRRFYSSSLLLVYEGDSSTRAQPQDAEANTTAAQSVDGHAAAGGQSPHAAVDSTGLHTAAASSSSLPAAASALPASRSTLPASFSSFALSSSYQQHSSGAAAAAGSSSSGSLWSGESSSSASAAPPPRPPAAAADLPAVKLYSRKRKTTHAQAMALARQRGSVDVRIIDFAHTSLASSADGAQQADDGVLRGLDSLLLILHEIVAEQDSCTGRREQLQAALSAGGEARPRHDSREVKEPS